MDVEEGKKKKKQPIQDSQTLLNMLFQEVDVISIWTKRKQRQAQNQRGGPSVATLKREIIGLLIKNKGGNTQKPLLTYKLQ